MTFEIDIIELLFWEKLLLINDDERIFIRKSNNWQKFELLKINMKSFFDEASLEKKIDIVTLVYSIHCDRIFQWFRLMQIEQKC